MSSGFAVFATPIGACAIAWTPRGIAGVQLPELDEAATRARMRARFAADEATPPPEPRRAIDLIAALLRGDPVALDPIALDLDGVTPFRRQVYAVARAIPPGATRTYGELALALGAPGAARAIGQAMGSNPFPIVVPCHRVLAAGGKLGGFSASGGATTKQRLLAIESAQLRLATL